MINTKKLLIVILVISAGYLLWDILANPGDARAKHAADIARQVTGQKPEKQPSKTSNNSKIDVGSLLKVNNTEVNKMAHYSQIWGRDPFIGELVDLSKTTKIEEDAKPEEISYENLDPDDYQFSAISYKDNRPTVLINSEVLKVGDSLDGMILEKVSDNSVLFKNGDRYFILKMKGSF